MSIDSLVNLPFVRAPTDLDDEVLAFCSSINPMSQPVRLVPEPRPGSVPGECYSNVERAINDGQSGAPVSGWLIWRWPNVFIEAEHHMVLDTEGTLIDVTPPADTQDAYVVFLPDPTTPFDFTTRKITPNKNRTLGYEPQARAFLDAGARQKAMHGAIFGASTPVDVIEYRSAEMAVVMAKDALLKRIRGSLGRNDACLCGSGKKYKRCHGP